MRSRAGNGQGKAVLGVAAGGAFTLSTGWAGGLTQSYLSNVEFFSLNIFNSGTDF